MPDRSASPSPWWWRQRLPYPVIVVVALAVAAGMFVGGVHDDRLSTPYAGGVRATAQVSATPRHGIDLDVAVPGGGTVHVKDVGYAGGAALRVGDDVAVSYPPGHPERPRILDGDARAFLWWAGAATLTAIALALLVLWLLRVRVSARRAAP